MKTLTSILLAAVVVQSATSQETQSDELQEYESGIETDALNTKEFTGNQWINFFVPEGFTADFLALGSEPLPIGVTASGRGVTFRWQFHTAAEGLTPSDLRRELETLIKPTVNHYDMPPPIICPIAGMIGVSARLHEIKLASGGTSFLEEGLFVLDQQLIRYRIFTDDLSSAPTQQARKSIYAIAKRM